MIDNEDRWRSLAARLTHQRVVVLGFKTRAEFVRHLGLKSDRVLHDLENARRTNYEMSTLLSLESWYQIPAGELREVLGDSYPMHDISTFHESGTIQSSKSGDATLEQLQESIDTMTRMLDTMRDTLKRLDN